MTSPLKVLVVDDSAFMRGAIARVLEADPRFEVVGQARDGEDAVNQAVSLKPDVITMDFNMPRMNGAQATRAILSRQPAGIVMLSAHTREGAQETVEALAAGAVDFVHKPDGEVSANLSAVKGKLVEKLLSAAGANLRSVSPAAHAPDVAPPSRRMPRPGRPMPAGLRVVAIASSTGGPAALARVWSQFRAANTSYVLVQHMPKGFTAALAEQLSEAGSIPVREGVAGDALERGQALIAPGGEHLVLDRSGRVTLTQAPPVHGVRPAADVTFKSVAQAFGARVVGVVLTGMGRDGATGLAAIKAAGGRTVAQDKHSSTVYGMPKAAADLGVVDEVVALDRVAEAVNRLTT